jgi:hypothetical protein
LIVALAAAVALSQSADQAHKILQKMVAVNSGVHSYVVRCHLDAAVRVYLHVHLDLDATYYFKQPDKAEVHFDTVPELARQFKNFYASTGTPATWPRDYKITLDGRDPESPDTVLLRLTPKQPGSLAYAVIAVETQTYGVVHQQWHYLDGSTINVEQQNERGPFYILPKHQIADFDFPHYKAHVIADFGDYQLNVPIDDSIFTK